MSKKLGKTLEGPFTKVARAMSRNYGITVVPSGFACCTDGKNTITIPFNADDMAEADQKILHGMLDHEVAHVVEEREALEARAAGRSVKTPMEIVKGARSNRERMFFNVFEDIRIETKASKQYVGVAENLNAANKHSVDAFRRRHEAEDGPKGGANFWHTFGSAIILKARGEDIGWVPAEILPYLDLVADEIREAPAARRAEDAHALALRVLEKVKDRAEEAKKEIKARADEKERAESESEGAPEEDGEPGFGGDDDDDEQEGPGEGEPGGEVETTPSDDTEEGGTGGPLADKSDEELEAMAEAGEEDAALADLGDLAREDMVARAKADAEENNRYIPNPEAQKKDRWLSRPASTLGKAKYASCKAVVDSQIHAMKARLITVLLARAEAHHVGDKERGSLDTAALYSLRLGNKRVFAQKTKADKINTAVTIVVDQSASMTGQKIECSRQMSVALAETFAALGIPFEIIGFHNRYNGGVEENSEYSRFLPYDFTVFKAFGESHRQVRERLGDMDVGEENVDGEALIQISRRLAARPENRKMMFVLSDGSPCGGCDYSMAHTHLKEAVKMIANSGIEVFGIGAKTDCVKNYYQDFMVVNEISELAVQVYKLVRSKLLTNRGAA